MFSSPSDNGIPILSILVTLHLYLLLNCKSLKLAYQVKGKLSIQEIQLDKSLSWLVVLRFNATLTAKAISW